jgi:hypothetical protein
MHILACNLEAQATQLLFTDKQQKISFQYNEQFQSIPTPLAEVLVALKSKQTGFPSFNIVSIAQHFSPNEISAEQYQERVLSDYRKVGYTEAVGLEILAVEIANQRVQSAQLKYPSTAGKLISLVTLLPDSPNSHLVLTYIDLEANFTNNKPLYDEIARTLKLLRHNNTNQLQITSNQDSSSKINYWTTFAILVVLVLVVGFAMRIRRTKSKTP